MRDELVEELGVPERALKVGGRLGAEAVADAGEEGLGGESLEEAVLVALEEERGLLGEGDQLVELAQDGAGVHGVCRERE